MVTLAEGPEPEVTITDKAEAGVRTAIAGHPQGAIRRIVLYVAACVLVLTPVPALALIPLLLLALTDQLA